MGLTYDYTVDISGAGSNMLAGSRVPRGPVTVQITMWTYFQLRMSPIHVEKPFNHWSLTSHMHEWRGFEMPRPAQVEVTICWKR